MSGTNVPQIQFTPTGLVVPTPAAVLAGTQADINAAFGGNLNMDPRTPQGQLAASYAAIINDYYAAFAYLVSQIDPDNAADAFQDAIGRLYFMNREAGTPTTVQVACGGALGTPIRLGAQIQDNINGTRYVCALAGVIPVGGSITLPFNCVNLGPTACPAGALSTVNGAQIISGVPGWDSIANALAGVVGANVETRAAYEFRREQSVALNAHGSIVAIAAAVFQCAGVIDVYAIENFTNATVNTGATNYPVVAHSIYVGVTGGLPADIGAAIFSKKNDGSNMNGNTTVTITDPSYSVPQPTYTYTYNIPTPTAFKVAVQIQNSANLPANIVALTQAAVVASFTGADGSQRARTASTVLAGKFYAPVAAIAPTVNVISVLLSLSPASPTLTNVTLGIDQFPTLQLSDVSVTLV